MLSAGTPASSAGVDEPPQCLETTIPDTMGNVELREYLQEQPLFDRSKPTDWAQSILVGKSQLHPAELSGASQNPDLQLLRVPREIRDKILRHLLVRDLKMPLSFCKSSQGLASRRTADGRTVIEEPHEYWCKHFGRLPNGDQLLSIPTLTTSKQFYEESRRIFFDENQFFGSVASGHLFNLVPNVGGDGLSASNIELITDLDLELTNLGRREFDELAIILCSCFQGLRSLSLSTSTIMQDPQNTPGLFRAHQNYAARSVATLLVFVARITHDHNSLKKAIWNIESGGTYTATQGFGLRMFRFTARINLFPVGRDREIFEQVKSSFNIHGRIGTSKNLVLDCSKIREAKWDEAETLLLHVQEFALPETALSSEPVTAESMDWTTT